MATFTLAYDDPAYLVRQQGYLGPTTAGNGTVATGKFVAFTAMQVYAAQATVITAGTTAGATLIFSKVSGTATTVLATATLGTSAAGVTVNKVLSTAAGGAALLQGDFVTVTNGTDATAVAVVGLEVGLTCLANLTQ